MAQGRKFAVFDIDGTLIRWQLYHAITDELARRGHIKPETYGELKQARLAWKRRQGKSFTEYERLVIDLYHKMVQSITPAQLDEAVEAVFLEYRDQVYIYTRDLIVKLKAEGYFLIAISGSHTEIVAKMADHYGFGDYIGSEHERLENSFSSKKTIGSRDKDKSLQGLVKKHRLDYRGSVGIGDSRSDISMLALVEQPIAFNPERELFEHAKANGWKIVLERKNVIYELGKSGESYILA